LELKRILNDIAVFDRNAALNRIINQINFYGGGKRLLAGGTIPAALTQPVKRRRPRSSVDPGK